MSELDFYKNERPQDEKPIESSPSWNHFGGGGGGGGGGAIWARDLEDDETSWQALNLPFLKRSPSGFLLTDGQRPELLTGSMQCTWPPDLMVWSNEQHAKCLLMQCPELKLLMNFDQSPPWRINFNWQPGGNYTIQAKWQSGHYDYNKIHQARFAAFGYERNLKIPLSSWLTVFLIRITADGKIFVNGIRCQLDGNKKFME